MADSARSAIDKALDLVEAVSRAETPSRLSDLAAEVDMHRATAYRVLLELVRRRWVTRIDDRYMPGPVVLQLSLSAATSSLSAIARPVLQRLSDVTGMMVNLQVLESDGSRVIDVVRPPRLSMISDLTGELLPLHRFAGPMALVAALDSDARKPYLDRAAADGHPLDGPEGLRADLEEVNARGFAVERGRNEKVIASLARAVLSTGGAPVCAVTVVGLDSEFSDESIAAVSLHLIDAAAELATLLVGPGGSSSSR